MHNISHGTRSQVNSKTTRKKLYLKLKTKRGKKMANPRALLFFSVWSGGLFLLFCFVFVVVVCLLVCLFLLRSQIALKLLTTQ